MQSFVPFVYDIATVIVFIAMIGSCAHKGFLRTLVSLLGFAAALFGAAICAKPLAEGIFRAFIRPPVVSGIAGKLSGVQADLLPESLMALVDSFPQILFDAMGQNKQQLLATLQDLVQNGGARAAESIADTIVAPLAITLLRAVLFLVIFGLAAFLVRKLAWLFGGVNELPLIGPANRVLGGVVGIAQAALTMYVVAVVLNFVLAFTGGELAVRLGGQRLVLAGSAVFESTSLFKAFVHFNPLSFFLLAQRADGLRLFEGAQFV